MATEPCAALNTDRELWREREGDYCAPSIHVTEHGGIGINCGGHVIVLPVRAWHALALALHGAPADLSPDHLRHVYQPCPKYPWFCEQCGYPEHERLKHTTSAQAPPPNPRVPMQEGGEKPT